MKICASRHPEEVAIFVKFDEICHEFNISNQSTLAEAIDRHTSYRHNVKAPPSS